MTERPGVMLYFDIEPGIKMLDDPQRGQFFTAIMEYARFGVIPDFSDPLLSMAWSFVKTSIDRDGERYEKSVMKKKISGITSDFKRNYAPKHGISPDDEEALAEYIRQRLSTSVDEYRPTTTTEATSFTTSSSKATADAEGCGQRNETQSPSFDDLRNQRIQQLLDHCKTNG